MSVTLNNNTARMMRIVIKDRPTKTRITNSAGIVRKVTGIVLSPGRNDDIDDDDWAKAKELEWVKKKLALKQLEVITPLALEVEPAEISQRKKRRSRKQKFDETHKVDETQEDETTTDYPSEELASDDGPSYM